MNTTGHRSTTMVRRYIRLGSAFIDSASRYLLTLYGLLSQRHPSGQSTAVQQFRGSGADSDTSAREPCWSRLEAGGSASRGLQAVRVRAGHPHARRAPPSGLRSRAHETAGPYPESTEEPRPESATCCFRWIWDKTPALTAELLPRVLAAQTPHEPIDLTAWTLPSIVSTSQPQPTFCAYSRSSRAVTPARQQGAGCNPRPPGRQSLLPLNPSCRTPYGAQTEPPRRRTCRGRRHPAASMTSTGRSRGSASRRDRAARPAG